MVILIGLAAKNGILIVEFANQLRDEGRHWRDAVIDASVLRLRLGGESFPAPFPLLCFTETFDTGVNAPFCEDPA